MCGFTYGADKCICMQNVDVTNRVYTFREEYRICGMAAIYSELLEDYFLTNINGDLFGDDDGTKDNTEEDTATIGTEQLILTLLTWQI